LKAGGLSVTRIEQLKQKWRLFGENDADGRAIFFGFVFDTEEVAG
jgi:hypothetical protein